MADKVRFDVKMNPRLIRLEDMVKLNVQDMKEMTELVDIAFVKHEKRLFASEGGSSGEKWAPLSSAYAKAKKKKFPGRLILVRSRKLKQSLTKRTHPLHFIAWALKPLASITFGTSDTTGAFHTGSFRNPNLPERDPLAHTSKQMNAYFVPIKRVLKFKLERILRVMGKVGSS